MKERGREEARTDNIKSEDRNDIKTAHKKNQRGRERERMNESGAD